MPDASMQRINVSKLASTLTAIRKKHGVSLNALSKLSGISRRTLARLEAGQWGPLHPACPERSRRERSRRASRTIMRLLRLFLPPDKIDAILLDSTRLSAGYAHQLGGTPDDYRLLDLLPDFYPYFLFHPPLDQMDIFIRQEYASDYRTSLHQLVLRPPRNLGLRLRAFRLRHDLTLVQTAALLGLSKSELHRIERTERSPSPQTAYRILRLLTLPALPGHHNLAALLKQGGAASQPGRVYPEGFDEAHSPSRARRAGTESTPSTGHEPAAQPEPLYPESRLVGTKGSPEADSQNPMERLRRLWLSGGLKTRDLAAAFGISQPHLIRLLRGDRAPSKKLLERISRLPR